MLPGMSLLQSMEIKPVPVWGHAVTWGLVTGFVTPLSLGWLVGAFCWARWLPPPRATPKLIGITEHPCSAPAGSSGLESWDVQEKQSWEAWSSQPLCHHVIVLCGEKGGAGGCAPLGLDG